MDERDALSELPADGAHTIRLPAALDHSTANELKASLDLALADSRDIEIDASAVGRITTQGIHVLVAARHSLAGSTATKLRISAPSAVFVEFSEMLALTQLLGLEECMS